MDDLDDIDINDLADFGNLGLNLNELLPPNLSDEEDDDEYDDENIPLFAKNNWINVWRERDQENGRNIEIVLRKIYKCICNSFESTCNRIQCCLIVTRHRRCFWHVEDAENGQDVRIGFDPNYNKNKLEYDPAIEESRASVKFCLYHSQMPTKHYFKINRNNRFIIPFQRNLLESDDVFIEFSTIEYYLKLISRFELKKFPDNRPTYFKSPTDDNRQESINENEFIGPNAHPANKFIHIFRLGRVYCCISNMFPENGKAKLYVPFREANNRNLDYFILNGQQPEGVFFLYDDGNGARITTPYEIQNCPRCLNIADSGIYALFIARLLAARKDPSEYIFVGDVREFFITAICHQSSVLCKIKRLF